MRLKFAYLTGNKLLGVSKDLKFYFTKYGMKAKKDKWVF